MALASLEVEARRAVLRKQVQDFGELARRVAPAPRTVSIEGFGKFPAQRDRASVRLLHATQQLDHRYGFRLAGQQESAHRSRQDLLEAVDRRFGGENPGAQVLAEPLSACGRVAHLAHGFVLVVVRGYGTYH